MVLSIVQQIEMIRDKEAIYKGMWLEAFKFSKEMSEMYGGNNKNAKKALVETERCRQELEEIDAERKKLESAFYSGTCS